jgi:hypothetical protein
VAGTAVIPLPTLLQEGLVALSAELRVLVLWVY